MLTRLYIDNFRCFEKFEWKPGRKHLIVGKNGTGKTSLMDALHYIVQISGRGDRIDRWFKLNHRTSWLDRAEQVFEIETQLKGGRYQYRLVLDPWGDPTLPRVQSETLRKDGDLVVLDPPLDPGRSALSMLAEDSSSCELVEFCGWLAGISCWHINPTSMGSLVRGSDRYPQADLRDFAAWYRRLVQDQPTENTAFLQDLRESLDCFDRLSFEHAEEDFHVLYAEFLRRGSRIRMPFDELSDGQRCLICLYAIIHFVVAKGGTVIIDEPDNFISLREIQPWLMSIEDMADDHKGQVVLISHHPEILNQWAGPYGVQFIRDGAGPVRVEKFKGDPESPLSAAELVARGWDLD